MKNAYTDILEYLEDGEIVESLVFGAYDWSEKSVFVPKELYGATLTLDQAKQYMDGWTFHGGYGHAECHSVYVWTNQRVIWVAEYDGSTCLKSMPRHPIEVMPQMS